MYLHYKFRSVSTARLLTRSTRFFFLSFLAFMIIFTFSQFRRRHCHYRETFSTSDTHNDTKTEFTSLFYNFMSQCNILVVVTWAMSLSIHSTTSAATDLKPHCFLVSISCHLTSANIFLRRREERERTDWGKRWTKCTWNQKCFNKSLSSSAGAGWVQQLISPQNKASRIIF